MKIKFNLEQSERIDQFLAKKIDFISREKIKKSLNDGLVLVNEKLVFKANFKLIGEGEIKLNLKEKLNKLEPWDRKDLLNIIFENNDYMIINKPSGLTVHPGNGTSNNTLVNILLATKKPLSMMDSNRPGIINRIDKNTSGLLIIAKNDKFHNHLQEQFKNRKIYKKYTLITEGRYLHKKGIIEAPIGRDEKNRTLMKVKKNGREAISLFNVIESFQNNEYVEFQILTGRTHQIRVHSKYIGNPILNDPQYSNNVFNPKFGQYLHSKFISFIDLDGNKVNYEIKEPIEFINKLIELK